MLSLSSWLAAHYDLPAPIECRLLRSHTNDVYCVTTPDASRILKVYGRNWRTEAEVRYEVALLQHLAARGMTIAAPIAGKDGDFVQKITESDGSPQQAVLCPYAPGEKPQPPFEPALYAAFGEAIARMHTLSEDFATPHPRRPLDLSCLIDEPVQRTLPLLQEATDRAYLTNLAGRVKARIVAYAAEGLDWGPIHGDATLDNLHVTPNGEVILYDFDSGGPGWRAADLQGWTVLSDDYAERGDAFRHGYSRIRPLRPIDLQAAPALTLAWDIWGLKIDLENRLLPQGPEAVQAYLQERLPFLQERDRPLLI